MATTAMDYEATGDRFEDDGPRYDGRRSASPRDSRGDDDGGRRRTTSPGGDIDMGPKDSGSSKDTEDGAINPGSNLFVTGIHPSLSEEEVTRLFEKYGQVEKCQIMRDPHTKESRGFGFVKMVTPEQADAARDALHGEMIEGRNLGIEKARRARPRTPTPGKYFGPPKRETRPRFERYDDRRRGYGGSAGIGGGSGGAGFREDPYRYRGYERRPDDRGYDRGGGGGHDRGYDRGYDRDHDRGGYRGGDDRSYDRRDRDDGYGGGGRGQGDRYGRSDRDRGAPRPYDRDRYDRPAERDSAPRPRDPPAGGAGYSDPAPRSDAREAYGGGASGSSY